MKKNLNLALFLKQVQEDYHRPHLLPSDPLEYVHRYSDPWDREAVAVLAAVLAYGNVKQIRRSIEDALGRMAQVSGSPKEFVRQLSGARGRKKAEMAFEGFVHRFNQGSDLYHLFLLIHQSWREHGSMGAHFTSYLKPGHEHIGEALSLFISEWRSWLAPDAPATFSYLLTSPEDGSCCKRWCMFLRWMGRKDAVDLGLWAEGSELVQTFLSPSQLVMPLDTHTGRMSQSLGLTLRKSLNWKAAVEVTQALKKIDPNDPTRFDFALSRIGILNIKT